jgi:hypothetical protein
MVKAAGDQTTFMPMKMPIEDIGMTDKRNGQIYWASNNATK